MPTTMADIRNGLVTNLETLQDAEGFPEVKPYRQASPRLPSIQVTGYDIDAAEPTTFQGGFTIGVLVQAFAGRANDQGAQERLDGWLYPSGTGSVWAAIETDKTLGGKIDDLFVTRHDGTQIGVLENQTEVLLATWHVQIEI
jgi:hypothetical protein